MYKSLIAATAAATFANAQEDKGIFMGAQQGLMTIFEEESLIDIGCPLPEMPEMFTQAEAMIPMAKMMLANMNEGVEPTFIAPLEGILH